MTSGGKDLWPGAGSNCRFRVDENSPMGAQRQAKLERRVVDLNEGDLRNGSRGPFAVLDG